MCLQEAGTGTIQGFAWLWAQKWNLFLDFYQITSLTSQLLEFSSNDLTTIDFLRLAKQLKVPQFAKKRFWQKWFKWIKINLKDYSQLINASTNSENKTSWLLPVFEIFIFQTSRTKESASKFSYFLQIFRKSLKALRAPISDNLSK